MIRRGLPEVDSEWRDQAGDSLSTEAPEALTSIHGTYTLASPHEPNANEVENLMVKNFLNTLAETALAIASRQAKQWTP
jgi:hypothetical protein